MRKTTRVQLLIVLLLLIGGVVGYLVVVPAKGVDLTPLGRLLINDPGFSGVPASSTAAYTTPVDSESAPSLRQGYDLDPGQTGSYGRNWLNTSDIGTGVTSTLEMLPTVALANLAYNEQESQSLAQSVITSEKGVSTKPFTFPGIAKSTAVSYVIPNTKGSIDVVVGLVAIDRAVVIVNIEGPAATRAHVTSIMDREAVLLREYVPTWPTMGDTTYSLGATLLWFGVMLVLIALVFVVPLSVRRAQAVRVAREQARRRFEVRSRGAKIMRHQRVKRR